MTRQQTQRLLYNPSHPHQAGVGIWLVKQYKKQDPERRLPRWKQWLRLRDQWMKEQEAVYGKNNLTCAICGKTGLHAFTSSHKVQATIDHILPVSKFPHHWNNPSNFQIACVSCNQKKGNTHTA